MSSLRSQIARLLGAARGLRYTVPASVVAAACVATLAACAGDLTSPGTPAAAPRAGLVSDVTNTTTSTVGTLVNGLLWTKKVSQTTVTKVIGPGGGSLSIPNGLQLTVPAGAVAVNTTFSITRLPGTIVAYSFEPHGTSFAKPLTLMQPTLGTNLFKLPAVTSIAGAYFKDDGLLNELTGVATVSEFAPTFVSADKAWITFTVPHFSGWMVSSGR